MGLFSRKDHIVAFVCKHTFPISGKLVSRNSDGTFQDIMTFDLVGTTQSYCPVCTWAGRTRCAWCLKDILLNTPVTLYTPISPNCVTPTAAELEYTQRPIRLIGCIGCADHPSHAAGLWRMQFKDGQPYFYVERSKGAFDVEKGTIAVSYYSQPINPGRNTERQIVSPIPMVGNTLTLNSFARSFRKSEWSKLKVIAAK